MDKEGILVTSRLDQQSCLRSIYQCCEESVKVLSGGDFGYNLVGKRVHPFRFRASNYVRPFLYKSFMIVIKQGIHAITSTS